MPASRTALDLSKVAGFFKDSRAGRRVDKVISDLLYELAVNYKPPQPDFTRVFDTVNTLADGDATPDVSGGNAFKTANTSSTTITNFDGGFEGLEMFLLVDDANTTIDFNTGTNITGNGGANYPASVGDAIHFVYVGGKWRGFISKA